MSGRWGRPEVTGGRGANDPEQLIEGKAPAELR
jgi:hypothetical protein